MGNKIIISKNGGMSTLKGAVIAIAILLGIMFAFLPTQLHAKEGILSFFNLVDNEDSSEGSELVPAVFKDNVYAYIYVEGEVSDESHIPSVSPLGIGSGIFNSFSDFEPKSSKCSMLNEYPNNFHPDGCLIFSYENNKKQCAVNLFDPIVYTPVLSFNQFNERYRVRENKINEIKKRCISGYSCDDDALDVLSYFYDYGLDHTTRSDRLDDLFGINLLCISSEENAYLWLNCDKLVKNEIIMDYATKTNFECLCPKNQPCYWKTV